jgi:murein DD-endopeptidase MepM/ murein hydrolase activator NlpD
VGAATEGRVILAGDFFYTGWSLFLDHGYGIVSGYFHMDRLVAGEGDAVAAGQKVGEVGSTGRSTGPHLHWSVYVSGVKVDPRSVVALTGGGDEAKPLDGIRSSP